MVTDAWCRAVTIAVFSVNMKCQFEPTRYNTPWNLLTTLGTLMFITSGNMKISKVSTKLSEKKVICWSALALTEFKIVFLHLCVSCKYNLEF